MRGRTPCNYVCSCISLVLEIRKCIILKSANKKLHFSRFHLDPLLVRNKVLFERPTQLTRGNNQVGPVECLHVSKFTEHLRTSDPMLIILHTSIDYCAHHMIIVGSSILPHWRVLMRNSALPPQLIDVLWERSQKIWKSRESKTTGWSSVAGHLFENSVRNFFLNTL